MAGSVTSSSSVFMQAPLAFDLYKCSISILKESGKPKSVSVRSQSLVERTITFESIEQRLNACDFKRAFRLSKDEFDDLNDKVKPFLQKNFEMGERARRSVITSRMRLGITLRMLAGSGYMDIMMAFGVGASTPYAVLHETCEVLSKVLKLPGIPKTVADLERVALGFKHSRRSLNPLFGCVGAIDGIAVKIRKPSSRYAAAYFCRKGHYSRPVQAVVDSSYRFLDVSVRCVGSTRDALAHAVSKLGAYLEKKGLRAEFWIIGDKAYLCTESLMTPIPLSQLKYWWQGGFNYYLSSLRVHVEQAFGMLVARWRILNALQYDVVVSSRIICVCMKLHNFCVDSRRSGSNDISYDEVCRRNEDVKAWYTSCKVQQWEDNLSGSPSLPQASTSLKRESLVESIKKKGLRRPSVLGAPIYSFE